MVEQAIAVIMIALLCGVSLWANRRFRDLERLPMQWSIGGTVNWTAPRPIALTFTPALGALILGLGALGILDPRPGQENLGVPVSLLMGLVLLAVHAFHLWMIERTVR